MAIEPGVWSAVIPVVNRVHRSVASRSHYVPPPSTPTACICRWRHGFPVHALRAHSLTLVFSPFTGKARPTGTGRAEMATMT
jgi:hypothetical protein